MGPAVDFTIVIVHTVNPLAIISTILNPLRSLSIKDESIPMSILTSEILYRAIHISEEARFAR